MRGRRATGVALLALVASIATQACAAAGSPGPASDGRLQVATTSTVFADLVANVGGADVAVTSLVPKNGDVHTFSPTPADARLLSQAAVVFMNGLGLDDWLTGTIADVGTKATVVKLAENLPGAEYIGGEDGEGANPHLWLDPTYAKGYIGRIADALAAVDPTNAATYRSNASAYAARLDALDATVRQQISSIPAANRRFVSFHDAFPYYARRYGLTIVGVAVEAPGQDPSAGYTAKLVQAIRDAHVKAVFAEAQFPPKLVDQIASETGTSVVANLYDDSLGDPPVTSYEAVITWDTDQFVKALR